MDIQLKKDWHGKKTVLLHSLEQLGLLILCESGVLYTNQAGGVSCMQPSEEGMLALIEDDYKMNSSLYKIARHLKNAVGLTEEDADFIDNVFRNNTSTSFLTVDRDRLANSMEAWLYVIIGDQPNEPLDAYDFSSANIMEYGSQSQWYEKRYSHINKPTLLPIYGFGESKGVLTWANSD